MSGDRTMTGLAESAGERIAMSSSLGWASALLREACGEALTFGDPAGATLGVHVEETALAFPVDGWDLVARGVWATGSAVTMTNVAGSGFDLRLSLAADHPHFAFRWRPPRRERAASVLLRSRFHLLSRQVLLQYPALWAAGTRGRVPLHASAYRTAGGTVLLAGPGGIGKSTLLAEELRAGGESTSDNVCVCDGRAVWGLLEPMRLEAGTGRRMPHGRREAPLPGRVSCLVPDRVLVPRRGRRGEEAALEPTTPAAAARSLAAGTYMAGELMRYWGFAATIALATGRGPVHPDVLEVAGRACERVPCFGLRLRDRRAATHRPVPIPTVEAS